LSGLETILGSAVLSNSGNNALLESIELLRREIRLLREFSPQPFVFLKSNSGLSSNVAVNVFIVSGPPVPSGFRATIRDFNLVYTTAAGTVQIVTTDEHGSIRQRVLRDITSTTNGIGETVLEEGERLAVVGQTAGAGTFEVFCTGSKQRFRE
jgi:hypothetical protein